MTQRRIKRPETSKSWEEEKKEEGRRKWEKRKVGEKRQRRRKKKKKEKKERISNGHAMDTRYKHTKKSTKRTKNTNLKTISKF